MSPNKWTIRKKLSALILLAFAAAVSFFYISYFSSRHIIEERAINGLRDPKTADSLIHYIAENEVNTYDYEKLQSWCSAYRGVDIEVFVDELLVYSSVARERSLGIIVRESELDKRLAMPVQFHDREAEVILYNGIHLYNRALGIGIVESCLLFFVIIILGIRSEVRYIRTVNEEIHVLEGGDLSKEITIRGSDEVTMLAESVDEFRKSMRNQLKTIEELEKSNRMMSAEIAHDLRTPLTSLIMYLDFAYGEIQGKEPQAEEYLTKAREKSVRLRNLLEENFSYYTTMTDYFMKEKQEVHAYEVMNGYLNDMILKLETEGFNVRSDISFRKCSILIQRDAVARVLGNLMTNILKYADRDGEVCICGREKDKYLEIRITNDVRIFDEGKPESTGFGARIVKRLIEEMDGEYSTCEKDGKYTTVLRFLKARDHESLEDGQGTEREQIS